MTEWGKLIRVLHHRRRNRQNLVWRAVGTIFTLKKQNGSFQLKVSALPVFCMLNLNDSIIWTGNRQNGIYQINKRTEEQTPLPQFSSSKLYMTYLYMDSQGNIWAGTNNDGLLF